MPVINLPQDTRWGDAGKGLGQLLGSVVSEVAKNQVQQGVGELLQDPSVSKEKLPGEVFKKYGNSGIDVLAKLNALDEQRAQITKTLAGAGLEAIQTRIKEATLPSAAPKAAAEVKTEEARPALLGAEAAQAAATAARTTALTGPEVAATQARTGQTQAVTATEQALLPGAAAAQGAKTEHDAAVAARTRALTEPEVSKTQAVTGLTQNESRKTAAEAEILGERLDRLRAAGGTEAQVDTLLAPFKLSPEELAAAKMTYQGAEMKSPGSGDAAMSAYVRNIVTSRDKREQPKPTPEPDQKVADATIQHATSAKRFIDEFAKGGSSQLGLLSGANFKTTMERYGWATGDVPLVDMWNAAQQQVASTATSGGGFFAQGRVKLAHDVTAGITETPLHALLATDQVADRMIAQLEGRITGKEGTSVNTKPLEASLAKWKEVKAITGTFKAEPTQDGKKTIAYFQGRQIDPKTFKTLLDPERTYDLGSGRKATGASIIQKLQEQQQTTGVPQMDPASALQFYRMQYKYSGRE
jgi:hypothetical protein